MRINKRAQLDHRDNDLVSTLRTIGVYGFDRESFLAALAAAGVDLLLDVRQRRGVRGSEYAWANAQRLETSLAEAGVDYTAALLCVERDAQACHRSLIAARLRDEYGFEVENLRP